MQRGVRVDQRLRRGQARQVVDGRLEPFAVGVLGVGAEVGELGVERLLPAVLRASDPDRRDERVVLAEPDEHAGQHPRDRGLGDPVVAPGDPGRRRALLLQGALVLLLPAPSQLGVGREPGAQVVLQDQHLPLQVGGEAGVAVMRFLRGGDGRAGVDPLGVEAEELAGGRERQRPPVDDGALVAGELRDEHPDRLAPPRRRGRPTRPSMVEMAVPGQRRDLGEQDRPGARPARPRLRPRDRRVDGGQAALDQAARPAASRLPGGAASAARTISQGRPTSAAWARIASISTWVTSTTWRRTGWSARRRPGRSGRRRRRGRGTTGWPRSPPAGAPTVRPSTRSGPACASDGGLAGGQAIGVGGPGRRAVACVRLVVDQAEPGVADELVEPRPVRQRRQRREPGPDPVPDLVRGNGWDAAHAAQRERERLGGGQVAVVQLVRPGQGRVPGQRRGQPQQPGVAEPDR